MLTPPTPETKVEALKIGEALFVADRLQQGPAGWSREVTYFFDGDEYQYRLQAFSARSEEQARRRLYGPMLDKELNSIFLRDVRLNMTRPH